MLNVPHVGVEGLPQRTVDIGEEVPRSAFGNLPMLRRQYINMCVFLERAHLLNLIYIPVSFIRINNFLNHLWIK